MGARKFIDLKRRGTGQSLLTGVKWCASYLCRLRGLMFRAGLRPGEALLFVEASQSRVATTIHMFFVPFAIAVVWMDNAGRVVDKALALPWRPAYAPRAPARYYLETHPDFLEKISIGDEMAFEDCAPPADR
jgi:uncharacterized membrane protein (UPF0127 family)